MANRVVVAAFASVIGLCGAPYANGQEAVGPVAPQGRATLEAHQRRLDPLLSPENVDKAWESGSAAQINKLLLDLQDAQANIQGIVGPVAPKPKPRPRPVTPLPKPKKEELEDAAADLRRLLEQASDTKPDVTLPSAGQTQLRKIAEDFTTLASPSKR